MKNLWIDFYSNNGPPIEYALKDGKETIVMLFGNE